jgi:hypothetical protein
MHGHVHARHAADARGGRTGGVDHHRGGDAADGRRHAGHGIPLARDARDLRPFEDADAEPPRAARKAARDLGGTGEAVPGTPHGRDQVIDAERRHELSRLLRRDHAHIHAEPSLERDPRLETPEVGGIGDEKEIADLDIAGIDAELLLEALEDGVSVENCARMPPAALDVVPLPTVSRSSTTTSLMPRRAR